MLASQPHHFSFMLVVVSVYVHSWRDGLRGPFSRCFVFLCILGRNVKEKESICVNVQPSFSFIFGFSCCRLLSFQMKGGNGLC